MTFSNDRNTDSENNNLDTEQEEMQQSTKYFQDMTQVQESIQSMQNSMPTITFKATTRTYEFVLDDDENPIELGNGNYGIVFLVKCQENKRYYAFKLLFKVKLKDKETLLNEVEKYDISGCETTINLPKNIENKNEFIKKYLQEFVNYFIQNYQGNNFEREIYERELQGRSFMEECLEREMGSDRGIGRNFEITNLVMAEDSIDSFRRTEVYRNFFSQHYDDNIFSQYGLILEKYDFNLQDILYKGIGKFAIEPDTDNDEYNRYTEIFDSKEKAEAEEESKKELNKEKKVSPTTTQTDTDEKTTETSDTDTNSSRVYQLNGFDNLTRMSHAKRLKTVHPIIEMPTRGIMYLHKAGLHHWDIKPANILIRINDLDSEFSDFKCALTDFGSLPGDIFNPKNLQGEHDRVLGTLGFRSPEQKYYQDTAFVLIGTSGQKTQLIINDVTFKKTIMEDGDYVVFSKYKEIPFEIEDINLGKYQSSPVIVTLKHSEHIDILAKEKEKYLQTTFYKMPTVRTDLFGIGGLFFHLMTCGESPEKFYEAIRIFDLEGSHVNTILDKYKGVKNIDFGEAYLIEIFKPFKDQRNNKYLEPKIVRLILKSMLYKAEGTFYKEALTTLNNDKSQMRDQATKILFDEFIKLKELF